MQLGTHRNRLADETSPYLRQHAANPVDWHPWDEAALRLAREQGKPILLSIGYSACHWCHVMAHESFEDETVAELMNRHFINIKVDREERPDLDKIYQLAHQILTRHGGGWPLTMFLTHDTQQPFFGGTYFPPQPRHGLPGFTDLLTRVAEYYHDHVEDIRQQSASLQRVFQDLSDIPSMQDTLDATPLQRARQTFEQQFDGEYGGFGGAPKFPHPRSVEWLLRHWHQSSGAEQPDLHALYMNALTLTRMAEGGIYDQLGGGFFRYSVDAHWTIPHFEKMLYDNAELLRVFAQTALATGEPLFRTVVQDTAHWLIGTLQSPQGAFWSTLDADSEGHEGQYYVWSREEIRATLPDDEFSAFAQRFDLDGTPNFEGRFHLRVMRGIDDIAQAARLETTAVEQLLAQARQRLLQQRATRIAPALDDKKLVSWNGLAISGLTQAARLLGNEAWTDAACAAVDEIRSTAWREGRLYAVITAQGESARFNAYLDDYAFLLEGLLELLQTRWRDTDLDFAIALADVLLERFTDTERGGFFFTANDHEALIHRSKSFADEAVPAGNAVATLALARLGWLTGETRYLDAAAGTLRAGWAALQQQPTAHATLLMALEEQLKPITLIVIRGADDEANEWRRSVQQLYSPRRMVVAIPPQAHLPDALAAKIAQADTVAYVCQGTTCSAPVKSLNALLPLAR